MNNLYQKDLSLKKRELLKVSTNSTSDEFKGLNFALTEVAINRKDSTSMIVINSFSDDEFLKSCRADGLIMAAPPGSTGYS